MERVALHREKKKPEISIKISYKLCMDFNRYCGNKNSTVSREIAIFIKNINKDKNKLKKYTDEKKEKQMSFSIERTEAEKFKKIIRENKYKTRITQVIINFMKSELKKEGEDENK